MAAPVREDQWRRRDNGDGDERPVVEEQEGEVVRACDSETDTDEYYNRDSPSDNNDDEADSSGCKGATATATSVVVVVVPAASSGGQHASTSSVARGWGGTGKRGRFGTEGSWAVSRSLPDSAEPDHQSMAAVAAAAPKAVLQPVPLAFALPTASSVHYTASAAAANLSSESSSAQSSLDNDDAMEAVVGVALAGAANPPAEPVAPPPPPPRLAPAAGRQNPDGYTCPKCGMWFATHQGLGGHTVGHKHRENRELMLAVPGRRDDDAKRERAHVCDDCGAEFARGVQLGGHKRKHWAGPPIVPKKKPRDVVRPLPPPAGPVPAADLMLPPVKTDEAAPPPAVETNPQPATATRSPVPGRLRLFGVDIVPAVQTPPAQQGSPATATNS